MIPSSYTTPYLDAEIIQNLQQLLQSECTWIQEVHPLAVVGVTKDSEGNDFKYPRVYKNDGNQNYYDIRPDDKLTCYSFFELEDPTEIDGEQITYNLSLIVWFNLNTVSASKNYDYSRELIKDIMRGIQESTLHENVKILSYEVDPNNIFDKYSMKLTDNQFLMFPYSAFKINFEYVNIDSSNCTPFT